MSAVSMSGFPQESKRFSNFLGALQVFTLASSVKYEMSHLTKD